eukprot:6090962-Prymnesium_polylepis.1
MQWQWCRARSSSWPVSLAWTARQPESPRAWVPREGVSSFLLLLRPRFGDGLARRGGAQPRKCPVRRS